MAYQRRWWKHQISHQSNILLLRSNSKRWWWGRRGVCCCPWHRKLVCSLLPRFIFVNLPDSGNLGRERLVFRLPVAELGLVDGVGGQVILRRLVLSP